MTDTATVRLGQVWADRDNRHAVTVIVTADQVNLRYRDDARIVCTDPGAILLGWRLVHELPRLACHDRAAALDAAQHLTGHGVRDVLVDGLEVAAPLLVFQARMFATDAYANGWAGRGELARFERDFVSPSCARRTAAHARAARATTAPAAACCPTTSPAFGQSLPPARTDASVKA